MEAYDKPKYGVHQSAGNRHLVMARIVEAVRAKAKEPKWIGVLEVGSYEGQSTLAWAHALSQHSDAGGITCIDTWTPYHSDKELASGSVYPQMSADLRTGDAFRRFQNNIMFRPDRVKVNWFQGTLEGAIENRFKRFGTLPFDIVFIDADHRYQAVKHDILLAKDWVRDGGILCGDDLEAQMADNPELQQVCDGHKDIDYINGFHPGVTLAVHEVFGRVWSDQGVWAVQKNSIGAGSTIWSTPEGL